MKASATSAGGRGHDGSTERHRAEAARERIIDAATALVTERGADELSVEAVCTRAGCSRATLYRYLGGRGAVLSAVADRRSEQVLKVVYDRVGPLTGHDRAVAIITTAMHAIRTEATEFYGLKQSDRYRMREYFRLPEQLRDLPTDRRFTVETVARIIWSLVDYPIADPVEERALIDRFAHAVH